MTQPVTNLYSCMQIFIWSWNTAFRIDQKKLLDSGYKPFLSFSAPKPKIYTGIVKYVGVLDRHDYSRRVYVGVRLDSPGKCNSYYCIGGVMVGVLTLSAVDHGFESRSG
jgi:hypothetical protein